MGRNSKLQVILTTEELNRIRGKAEMLGLSVSAYARLVLLHSQIKELEVDLNRRKANLKYR